MGVHEEIGSKVPVRIRGLHTILMGFQVGLVVKNPPAKAGGIRDAGWISGLGISPG